ncbi:MAG: hypothetical protein REH83_00825 [Rickettsiella sp.]|nr:hypothetical protein [Rickettsiella sp.]
MPTQPPLWLTTCLSVPNQHYRNETEWVETNDWFESLQTGIATADFYVLQDGYQQLCKQLDNLIEQPLPAKENQEDLAFAILMHLLIMQVYLEYVDEISPHTFFARKASHWRLQINQVLTKLPYETYLKQLGHLAEYICKKSIHIRKVDGALFKIYQHSVTHYFQQFENYLLSATEKCLYDTQEYSAYEPYNLSIVMLYNYTSRLSSLSYEEKEQIPQLLLWQLTDLIRKTNLLDLSPSWTERLKKWIENLFRQLRLWYSPEADTETHTTQALLEISQRLQKSAKKALRNKNSPSIQLLRERLWLYFSLHQQLITYSRDKELALEHQSIALALFEPFISTFDREKFDERVLKKNPFKPKASLFNFIRIKLKASNDWKPLVNIALSGLCDDYGFFRRDWNWHHINEDESFIFWLIARYKPRLLAEIEAYLHDEAIDLHSEEIKLTDKLNICRFVQQVYTDLCSDLNQITQMILSVWFKEVGHKVSSAQIGFILEERDRWLNYPNQNVIIGSECPVHIFALYMQNAVARLGAGLYFYPTLQQRCNTLRKAWDTYSGHNRREFFFQHQKEINTILNKLLLLFHPDRQSITLRENKVVRYRAIIYLPQIKALKDDLQAYRAQKEVSKLKYRFNTDYLLTRIETLVLDCMTIPTRETNWTLSLLSLPEQELQENFDKEIYEWIVRLKQLEIDVIKIRRETKETIEKINKKEKAALEVIEIERREKEAALEAIEKERREKEAAQAEIEHLKLLLAASKIQTSPQPSALAGSRVTLFPALNESSISNIEKTNLSDVNINLNL